MYATQSGIIAGKMSARIYRPIPGESQPDRVWLEFGDAVRVSMSIGELADLIRVCHAARTYYEDGCTGDVPMYPEDAMPDEYVESKPVDW